MSTKYKTVITTAGAAKLAAATVPGGKKVNITAMAVGDGGGTLPEPNASQTKLINEVWRHALNKISQDNKKKNYIVAELVIPPEEGGFWMRELGLYDDAGTLIAVANMAESYKPKLEEGSGRAQTCRMVIIVSSIESVELTIDSTTVMATQEYVDDKLAEHEQSRRHPDATLKEKGFTQLSSATDSSSETLAATPKAVKAAYDLANAKYTAVDATTAKKGIVQLSSSTNSDSEAQAATPKAVKAVNDKLTQLEEELGTAALKDAVTSTTDTKAGRTPVVGWMGLGGDAINVSADSINALPIPAYSSIKRYSPSGSSFFAGISAFCYKNGDGSTNFAEFMAPITGSTYPFVRNKDGMQLIFTNKNPPKPSDVGALPLATSALSVDLNTLGSNAAAGVYYQTMTANATTANHYPIAEAGSLLVTPGPYGCQQEYTGFVSGRKFVRGLAAQWNGTNGPWNGWKEYFLTDGGEVLGAVTVKRNNAAITIQNTSSNSSLYLLGVNEKGENLFYVGRGGSSNTIVLSNYNGNNAVNLNEDGSILISLPAGKNVKTNRQFEPSDYGNFDARYQAKGNYTPAGEAYTKAASDARYVQNIRVSATQVRSFSDGGGYSSNDAAFATAIAMVGGSSNNGSLLVRYVQKNINGTWVNITT
ncbi:phage tail protein [Citrobacter koseri]|uniref:phage tail-collar fiber domain-containing protein n=1 Tax=Citrobacter koseri TaxID=545 RepID=UPI002B3ED9DF|nr:phage tail protein [Citrobacter koseri]MEB2729585.1 phage tail protein [Citrobacter koseri]